jgi:hypothetical protein
MDLQSGRGNGLRIPRRFAPRSDKAKGEGFAKKKKTGIRRSRLQLVVARINLCL